MRYIFKANTIHKKGACRTTLRYRSQGIGPPFVTQINLLILSLEGLKLGQKANNILLESKYTQHLQNAGIASTNTQTPSMATNSRWRSCHSTKISSRSTIAAPMLLNGSCQQCLAATTPRHFDLHEIWEQLRCFPDSTL